MRHFIISGVGLVPLLALSACQQPVDPRPLPLATPETFRQAPARTVPVARVQTISVVTTHTPVNAETSSFPFGRAVAHFGERLITVDRRTLYTFDQDMNGVSTCHDVCTIQWKPFMATADAVVAPGTSIITRRDGSRQWAANGKPLYTFVGDTSLNDQNGASVPGWQVGVYQG